MVIRPQQQQAADDDQDVDLDQDLAAGPEDQDDDDAPLPDDDLDPDADNGDGGDIDGPDGEPEPQHVSRSQRRVRAALAERDRERARADEAERRANSAQNNFQTRQETDAQREARYAAMPAAERTAAMLADMRRENAYNNAMQQFRANDYADKAAFDARAKADPRIAKYSDEVERQLIALRRQGQNVDRDSLLRYIVGDAVMKNPARKKTGAGNNKQRDDAQRRIDRETTNPPRSTRGDKGSSRGETERTARRRRLENMPI